MEFTEQAILPYSKLNYESVDLPSLPGDTRVYFFSVAVAISNSKTIGTGY
jgi:hypothetical protein